MPKAFDVEAWKEASKRKTQKKKRDLDEIRSTDDTSMVLVLRPVSPLDVAGTWQPLGYRATTAVTNGIRVSMCVSMRM